MNEALKAELALTRKALRLETLDKLVIKSVLESKGGQWTDAITEFYGLKRELKKYLMDRPIVKVADKNAQKILLKISKNELFVSDKLLKHLEGISQVDLNIDSLSEDEIEELGSLMFQSWFSKYEYVQGMYDISPLIVGITVPNSLKEFISEARNCFAFQQYNAVYSLCRTIIEVTIRDIATRRKLIRKNNKSVIYFERYDRDNVKELINKTSHGTLRDTIASLYYDKTSFLIHGHKTISYEDAKNMFVDTLTAVQDLYAKNGY